MLHPPQTAPVRPRISAIALVPASVPLCKALAKPPEAPPGGGAEVCPLAGALKGEDAIGPDAGPMAKGNQSE